MEVVGLDNEKWDDRYNPMKSTGSGVNDYLINNLNSRIKDTVKNYYNDSTVWPESVKAYIVTQDLCVGKRSEADITKDGSTECMVKLVNQQLGLLNVYEYMQASLDNNCTSTKAISCENYNWLGTYRKRIWTVTGDANDSSRAYYVFQTINSSMCNNSYSVNTVFNSNTPSSLQLTRLPLLGIKHPKSSFSSLKIFFKDGGCLTPSFTEKDNPSA